MSIPQIAFLSAGLNDLQRAMVTMGVPTRGPSMESVEAAWNDTLREIAGRAVPGSVKIGELLISGSGVVVMVTYEIDVPGDPE